MFATLTADARRIAVNLSHGIYGNRSEVNTQTLTHLTEGERLAFFSDTDVRELLASLPVDAFAECVQDIAEGKPAAFAYRN